MTSVQKSAKSRMLAVNDRGYVIGEQHLVKNRLDTLEANRDRNEP